MNKPDYKTFLKESAQKRAKVRRMLQRGMSAVEVGRAMSISRQRVYQIARQNP